MLPFPVQRVASVMGLRRPVHAVADLDAAIAKGLPKSALTHTLERVYDDRGERARALFRVVPKATWARRETLKPEEGEKTERLARVVAYAEYVWDDREEAKRFLNAPHRELGGSAPIASALTELGARRVEDLLSRLLYGLPA